jgi:hypothetical protein
MDMLPGSLHGAVANELLFYFMISSHNTTTPVHKYVTHITLSVCLYVKWENWYADNSPNDESTLCNMCIHYLE